MSKIKIMLAEDHVLVREGTKEMLDREEDIDVVAEAGDGEEAVRLATGQDLDIVIMDIALPKLNGIEATKQIKEISPGTAILVLTAYDDDEYVFALLEAGAAGYLLKDVSTDELVEAIRAVQAGESMLHPAIARKVVNRFSRHVEEEEETPLEELTEREIEVLQLAGKGITNREIADSLSISHRTVQAHLSHIFSKLGVGSRTEAVVYALRKGLITFDDVS
ncbi:MAG: response regulator transcription factor [Anaerolineae bacterium]|nr:response regulator transcription factor [Anaerolineae bacterium]